MPSPCAPRENRLCFNGAAAKSSGKFAGHCSEGEMQLLASMGPPLKAAENPKARGRLGPAAARFNGAAAKSSGKSFCDEIAALCREGFNGAAAKSSGKYTIAIRRGTSKPRFNGAAAKSSGK